MKMMSKIYYLFFIFLVSCISTTRDNSGLNVTNSRNEVVEIFPIVTPMVVVSKSFKNQDVLYETVEEINKSIRWKMFYVVVDDNHHHITQHKTIYGTILISEMTDNLDYIRFINEGYGQAKNQIVMGINVYGEIQFSKIYMEKNIFDDREYLRSYLIHNLGISMGLEIDENSIDVNSCLQENPLKGCVLTDNDIMWIKSKLESH